MTQQFAYFQWTRTNFLQLLKTLSLEQLNKIPDGCNNNIIWNAGHIHFVQQFLVYKLAGLPMEIPEGFLERYVSGSRPNDKVNQSEVDFIFDALGRYSIQTKQDYEAQRFGSFEGFSASYYQIDYEFERWEQAFTYNNLHEALHFGFIRAQALVVTKSS